MRWGNLRLPSIVVVAMTVTGFLSGVAVSMYIAFVPIWSSSSRYAGNQLVAETHSTFWEERGALALVFLLVPSLLLLVPLVALLTSRYTLAGLTLWITALHLLFFGFITAFGFGTLYLPTSMLMLLTAWLHGRTKPSAG